MENKRIQEVFETMNKIYAIKDRETIIGLFEKLTPILNDIYGTLKEIVSSNEDLYNCMFMMNFVPEKRIEIISKHLGVSATGIRSAGGKTQDIFTFCASTMAYEIIGNLDDAIGPLYSLSLQESCMAWTMMTKKGMLLDLIAVRKQKDEDLIPAAAAHIKKMSQKLDIGKILDSISYSEEDDEEVEP